MKLCKYDLLANIFNSIEGILDIHCQSKDMADFLNLQGRLESPSLKPDDEIKHIPPRKPLRNQAFFRMWPEFIFSVKDGQANSYCVFREIIYAVFSLIPQSNAVF